MPIVGDEFDKVRFLKLLFHMNDTYIDHDWDIVAHENPFHRPEEWPERQPLVNVVAFTLMPNHAHLLLKEIEEGGISAFMQKVGQSMTNHFNLKYHQKGSLFQGPYRGKTINDDEYLRYVAAYIMVKNVFELYPKGGLKGAITHFDPAWRWAVTYRFSSLSTYAGESTLPILETGLLGEIFSDPRDFKEFGRDVILGGKWTDVDMEA